MKTLLIDSDILIEVTRGRDEAILAAWLDLADSDAVLLVSAITVAEVWSGARPAEEESISALFRCLTCVPVDNRIARLAARYLQQYRKSHGVTLGDAVIAASAYLSDATLWSRNRKHYPMPDLSFF